MNDQQIKELCKNLSGLAKCLGVKGVKRMDLIYPDGTINSFATPEGSPWLYTILINDNSLITRIETNSKYIRTNQIDAINKEASFETPLTFQYARELALKNK